MNKRTKRFKQLIIDRPLDEIADTLEHEGAKQALEKAVPFLAVGLGTVGLVVLLLVLLYASLGVIGKIIAPLLVVAVLIASYFENKKSFVGSATIKEPTMEQYITVGNIVKMAAKRVAPVLELSTIFEETDVKAAKDERIVPKGKIWLFKYRLLKKSIRTIIDEGTAQRVFQNELQMVLEENPAGFDKVRFIYGGVDECILQVAHVSQGDLYIFIYLCYASEDYFFQREQERDQHGRENTGDTFDVDF